MTLLIYVPNGHDGPVPAFMGINFWGNHATCLDEGVSLPALEQMAGYGPEFELAPRPVYVASASEDLWADPKGEVLSLSNAAPVYALYGYKGISDQELPPVNTPISLDIKGYHLRQGKHDIVLYDWQQYVAFADRFLK